jgi:hypothetical protein
MSSKLANSQDGRVGRERQFPSRPVRIHVKSVAEDYCSKVLKIQCCAECLVPRFDDSVDGDVATRRMRYTCARVVSVEFLMTANKMVMKVDQAFIALICRLRLMIHLLLRKVCGPKRLIARLVVLLVQHELG